MIRYARLHCPDHFQAFVCPAEVAVHAAQGYCVSGRFFLRVRSDSNYRDLALVRAVTPEYSIRPWRLVLGIGLKDLGGRIKWVFQGMILVGLKARMFRVRPKQPESLGDLFEHPFCLR